MTLYEAVRHTFNMTSEHSILNKINKLSRHASEEIMDSVKEYVDAVDAQVFKKTGKTTEELLIETISGLIVDLPASSQRDQRATAKMILQMKFGGNGTGLSRKQIRDIDEADYSEAPPLPIDAPSDRPPPSLEEIL